MDELFFVAAAFTFIVVLFDDFNVVGTGVVTVAIGVVGVEFVVEVVTVVTVAAAAADAAL